MHVGRSKYEQFNMTKSIAAAEKGQMSLINGTDLITWK